MPESLISVSKRVAELEKMVADTPALAKNAAVTESLDAINKKLETDPEYFDALDGVFEALTNTIPKLASTDSNGADITSGVLEIASALIKAIAIVSGGSVITEACAYVVKIVGSIVGAFGSYDGSYKKQLETMISDAMKEMGTDAAMKQLSGQISEMQSSQELLASILSKTYADPKKLIDDYKDFSVKYFVTMAEDELGQTIYVISSNANKDSRKNWSNAADTFYMLTQLIAYKALFMLEGISFYNLAEDGAAEKTLANQMVDSLNDFMVRYAGKGAPFFAKPNIQHAAITQFIYRFSDKKFRFVYGVYNYFSPKGLDLWSAAAYKFDCKLNTHNVSLTKTGFNCVRLSTLYATRDSNKEMILTIPPYGQSGSESDLKNGIAYGNLQFVERNGSGTSHFSFFPAQDNVPYITWTLEARNTNEEYIIYHDSRTGQNKPGPHNNVVKSEHDLFVFEVFPSQEELNNKDDKGKKLWPNDWKHKPASDRVYFIVGLRNENKIWTDHNGNRFDEADFYDVVYNSKHYGNPEHCMWFEMRDGEV